MGAKPQVKRKKPYQPPRLVRHGDVKRLTGTKGGASVDGSGKPNTYYSGTLG